MGNFGTEIFVAYIFLGKEDMSNVIKTKKGLDITLVGEAPAEVCSVSPVHSFGVVPDHYCGFVPRLSVQVGDRVLAGDAVMYHKGQPELKLTAPISGEVVDIKRGAKRKIEYLEIKPDATIEYKSFDTKGLRSKGREEIVTLLAESGLMTLFRKRPYDRIVDLQEVPRDIYVTGYLSAPLMPDVMSLVGDEMAELQEAMELLAKLTTGSVYLGVKKGTKINLPQTQVYEIDGPHPAGCASFLINKTKPLNQGETIWTIGLTELLILGRFLRTGKVDMRKRVAFAGSRMNDRGLAEVLVGSDLRMLTAGKLDESRGTVRLIDGDVLSGVMVYGDYRHMSPFTNLVTAIPEGDDVHEMLGWAMPGFKKYSVSRAFPTFLLGKNKAYDIDARLKGGERAIIVSNEYDKVFPLDIFPEQLVKATIAFNIDKMEQLGIYEVAPEDFAVCEFVDTSKLELQYIIRQGLDQLYKELN